MFEQSDAGAIGRGNGINFGDRIILEEGSIVVSKGSSDVKYRMVDFLIKKVRGLSWRELFGFQAFGLSLT